MGCLWEFLNAAIYLFWALVVGIIFYAWMGWGFLVLLPLAVVALWLQGIWDASRPGEFLDNVLGRLGWSDRAPAVSRGFVPRPDRSTSMPTLPEHIAALRGDLHALLAKLYHALHSPDSLRAQAVIGGVSSRLTEYGTALIGVYDAAAALKERVFDAPDCAGAARRTATTRLAVAVEGLIGVYGAAFSLLAEHPAEDRRIRLERNMRANLECLSMFIADILLAVSQLERILLEGRPVGGNRREVELRLRLSYPEELAELDGWADPPTGYEAGHVREALAIARDSLASGIAEIDDLPTSGERPAPRRGGAGGWLIPPRLRHDHRRLAVRR